jgi:small subunit ribosomal protein S5
MRRASAPQRRQDADSGFDVRVVQTNKVSKTHKGGKTMSWSVLVVVGDGQGKVGAGMGKARGIPDAIRKGEEAAKRAMFSIPMNGHTIPHQVLGMEGATKVMLRPASPGTGVVAGGSVRQILEAAGLHDVLAKTLGSRNAVNCAWAAVDALKQLVTPKDRAAQRGMELKDIAPWFATKQQEVQEVEASSEVS